MKIENRSGRYRIVKHELVQSLWSRYCCWRCCHGYIPSNGYYI